MKSILLVSVVWLWVGEARANCTNGLVTSANAALRSATQRFGSCRVASVKQVTSWPSESLESWRVDINCANHPQRSYSVSLKSCSVTRVQLSPLGGRHCGLSDTWGGEEPQLWNFNKDKTLDLRTMAFADLRKLPEHTKAQIRKVAESDLHDIVKVVGYLKDSSEANEVYVYEFEHRGQSFDAIEFFPGGNSYGLIFERGTAAVVASNGDGDISCSESYRARLELAATDVMNRSCLAPWGGTVPDGVSVKAYREARPPKGQPCASQYRRCSNGYLSGYYRYRSCYRSY